MNFFATRYFVVQSAYTLFPLNIPVKVGYLMLDSWLLKNHPQNLFLDDLESIVIKIKLIEASR
ncbi:MAG TPA: hypothetical protein VK175_15890 [Leadbetterella sp.]|nr:hypothetical protein [Leadbetterella sp.]